MSSKTKINKESQKVGLHINVSNVKSIVKDTFSMKPYKPEKPKSGNETVFPKFKGGHHYIAGVLETMIKIIRDELLTSIKKDNKGMYTITIDNIKSVISDDKFRPYYHNTLCHYESGQNYIKQLPLDKLGLEFIIRESNDNIMFGDNEVLNLCAYLLVRLLTDIISNCYVLLKFSGKTSLEYHCVENAIELLRLCDEHKKKYMLKWIDYKNYMKKKGMQKTMMMMYQNQT